MSATARVIHLPPGRGAAAPQRALSPLPRDGCLKETPTVGLPASDPRDAPQRIDKDRLALSLSRLRNVYSDNLIEVTEWCMSLDPLSRPQSVFALQKELARETERRYTKLSFGERLKLQLENLKTGAKP